MRGKGNRSPPTQRRVAPSAQGDPSRVLAFQELEVPVGPLLDFPQEVAIGTRIQAALRRLAALLPRHPLGYRRILARIQWILSGGAPLFAWFPLRPRMEADAEVAARALRRAESRFQRSPGLARRSYDEGVDVLRRYRLDPETLHQWSRGVESLEAGNPQGARNAFDAWEEHRRVDRVLRKLVRVLDRERDRLVLPNLRLVLKEVFRYRPVGMKRSDLFQEGILGLYKATFRFDARRGVRFSTYATFWIRQSIRKGLADRSRLIRVPQAIQEALRKRDGSLSDIETDRLRRILRSPTLFSAADSDDSRGHFALEIPDPGVPEHSRSLHLRKVPRLVQDALSRLSSKQRDVLQRRFGLGGERPETLEEIGSQLNLSRERIRQIEQEAILTMRRFGQLQEAYEDLQEAGVTVATTRG